MNTRRLQDRVAVVTGASRGLGRAIALALGREGVRLVLAARNRQELVAVAGEVKAAGGQAEAVRCDVTCEAEVALLTETVVGCFGAVHILVNSAGVNVRKPVTEFSLAEWRQVLDTNLTGVFLMCRALVPLMKGQRYGRILNLTSIMSHVALPGRAAYAASKAGLLGFTKALALELAEEGITVNGISPGPVATAMNKPILENPQAYEQFLARLPVRRWASEEEITGLALYLCAPEAGFITGTDVVIDGGCTAQ